jgi:hypothetical protein
MLDPFDYKVEPILQCKTKKADFVVKGKDNKQKLIIEVAQKIVGDDKTENYKHFQHTVPYGFPDKNKNENVTANMVSKICATKGKEEQLIKDIPSVIWIDFQDSSQVFSHSEHCLPLLSFNGALTSGGIWLALYGWKGAPLLEHYEGLGSILKMQHDGRFVGKTLVSAFICSFPDRTVILENPQSINFIPLWFKTRLIRLHNFSIEYSLFELKKGFLKQLVTYQKKFIELISNGATRVQTESNRK